MADQKDSPNTSTNGNNSKPDHIVSLETALNDLADRIIVNPKKVKNRLVGLWLIIPGKILLLLTIFLLLLNPGLQANAMFEFTLMISSLGVTITFIGLWILCFQTVWIGIGISVFVHLVYFTAFAYFASGTQG